MRSRLPIIFIVATILLDGIGAGLIFPVLPDLILDVTGKSLAEAAIWGGVLATGYAVMQFLFGPIVGSLSDRYGRKPILISALFVLAIDYMIMAIAGSIWLLLLGRIIAGLMAATYSTASAFMADISAPEDRERNFGIVGAAMGVGFA
jgi:DHA1 family tetracycline resistance protein-like MFS transporter